MVEKELSESEVAKRRDAALLRALSTPHKKQADMKVGGMVKIAAPSPKPKGDKRRDDNKG